MATTGNGEDQSQSSSNVSQVLDSAKDMASQVGSQVKDKATHLMDRAKGEALSRADQQRQSMASGIRGVAQAFHGMGDDLRRNQEGPIAEYASHLGHSMAGKVEEAAKYLERHDLQDIVADAQAFGRRSPAVFLGGAFLLGFAISRFLKSSRPARNAYLGPDIESGMPDPNFALPPAGDALRPGGMWVRGGADV